MLTFPPFNPSLKTRILCLTGLALSWVLSILSLIFAAFIIRQGGPSELGTIGRGDPPVFNYLGFPQLLSICVAVCTRLPWLQLCRLPPVRSIL